MTEERRPPTDRESPVGAPVVRGDEAVTGDRAGDAVRFDPEDPERVAAAAETVGSFAADSLGDDHVFMLRGAAACAALVRAEGSYKAAAERADGDVGVSFIRKWARVHDLPRAVREHVASGQIPPTAAKHIARVSGDTRYLLAWAVVDNDLTVREVRSAASAVADGRDVAAALAEVGATAGELTVALPADVYRDLRRETSGADREPADVVADALRQYLD
jgi:hypothetical protein